MCVKSCHLNKLISKFPKSQIRLIETNFQISGRKSDPLNQDPRDVDPVQGLEKRL